MPKYLFDHPHDWLNWKVTQLSQADKTDELCSMLRELAEKVDDDTIQDCFQTEMEQDGYFEETK